MQTLFPVIFTDEIAKTRDFYTELFGFEVLVEISWYVHLQLPVNESMQIAFVAKDHYSVPEVFQAGPAGVAITLEFDDIDRIHIKATEMGLQIHVGLRDEEWGQRHFVTEDPTGLMVDVVKPIPPSREFLVEHGLVDAGASGS